MCVYNIKNMDVIDLKELKNIKGVLVTPSYRESKYRNKLAENLNGIIEVSVPIGFIDVVTSDSIIEVKLISDWKAALGQIMAYGIFYPDHEKKLHLLFSPNSNFARQKVLLEYTLTRLGVKVDFELLEESDYTINELIENRCKILKENTTLLNIELAKLMKKDEPNTKLKSLEMWISRNREDFDIYNSKKQNRQEILKENYEKSNIEISKLIQDVEPNVKLRSIEMWVSRNRDLI